MPGARPPRHPHRGRHRGFAVSLTTKALPALLLNGLARTSGVAAFPMAAAAQRLTFPKGAPHRCPPFGELTGPQQRAMRTLANLAPGTGPTSC